MRVLRSSVFTAFLLLVHSSIYGQLRGQITKAGDGTMDPNGDGFISETSAGFSIDGYYVDEFELKMFGIPIVGAGDTIGDVQAGKACGVTDLAVDTAGYSVYGVLEGDNLIFRFRIGDDNNSVEAYTILVDTDNRLGPSDPNATPDNPGFELDITLIKNQSKGIYVYNIDGIESCPTEEAYYPFSSHFQKSVAGTTSCGDPDYFYDFYIPFEILNTLYGITAQSEIRFVALTNISATCAMGGKISDIGGVDDSKYATIGEAFLALSESQCPTALEDLCQTCAGFKVGTTEKPVINQPVKVGEREISGTAESLATIFLSVFDEAGSEVESLDTSADIDGNWLFSLTNPLTNEDSITARAQIEGACSSGLSESDISYAVVVINTPTVINGTTTSLNYTENSAAISIFNDLSISDIDDTELDSAWVTVTDNYLSSEDIVGLPPGQGLNISWISATNQVRIYGKASLGVYGSVLRGITYANTSENPDLATRTFTVQVNDGLDMSNVLTRSIDPVRVNDPPVISGTTTTIGYQETDTKIIIDNSIAISDVDNTTMSGATVSIIQGFDPVEDQLVFTDQNGITGAFDGTTGILTLTGIAVLVDYQTALASVEYLNIHAGDDPVETISDPTRIVRFQVNDGVDASNTTQRSIDMLSSPNNAPVFVDNLTDKNPLDTIYMTINEDAVLDTCLTAFDTDGDQITLSLIGLENNEGIVDLEPALGLCFTFTPNANYNGEEYIKFQGCDDAIDSQCDDVVVAITILPVNDTPIIVDPDNNPIDTVYYSTNEDTPANFCLNALDIEFDPIELSDGFSLTGNGNVTIPDPSILCFDYTPDANFYGTDTLRLVICEAGSTTQCDTIFAIVDVLPINDPPIITFNDLPVDTLYFDALEDIITELCLTADDPDMDFLQVVDAIYIEGPGRFEEAPLGDMCFFFESDLNANGVVYAKIVVCDDKSPALCDTVVVAVTITPVNDLPIILDENNLPVFEFDSLFFTINEDESIDICINAKDVEDDPLELADAISIQGDGTYDIYDPVNLCFTYTPELNYSGQAIGELTVCESGSSTQCVNAVVVFEILPVNDPPIIEDDVVATDTLFFETDEDTPTELCLVATDADGNPIEITAINFPNPNGTFDPGDLSDLCILYTPDDDFNGEVVGEVIICDNQDPALCDTVVVVIDVNPVNDPPELSDENGNPLFGSDTLFLEVQEDGILSTCVDATDPDGDPLIITEFTSISSNGLFDITDPTGLCIQYTPNPDFNGREIGSITVCEDQLDSLCASAIVVIDVIPVNDPPAILSNGNPIDTLFYEVDEDTPLNICLETLDVDGQPLSIDNIITTSTNGTFTVDPIDNLCILFTPELNYFGEVIAEVVICDDQTPALCDTVVIYINVLPVNDPPQFLVDGALLDTLKITIDEDSSIEFCLMIQDPENNNVTDPQISSKTKLGSYQTVGTDKCFLFTPAQDVFGVEYASVTVCDDEPLCNELVIQIIIESVNDTPLPGDDYFENDIYSSFAGNVLDNDTDIENDHLSTVISNPSGLHGTLEFNEDGSFKYKPSRKFVGEESFEYLVCDNGEGPACATAKVIFSLNDPLTVWQAVSPNGDNMNDYWIIEGIELFPDNKVQIFDRYNNLIYEVETYNNQDVVWHGQSNRGLFKNNVPDGSYFYLIYLGDGEDAGVPLNGFIILKNN